MSPLKSNEVLCKACWTRSTWKVKSKMGFLAMLIWISSKRLFNHWDVRQQVKRRKTMQRIDFEDLCREDLHSQAWKVTYRKKWQLMINYPIHTNGSQYPWTKKKKMKSYKSIYDAAVPSIMLDVLNNFVELVQCKVSNERLAYPHPEHVTICSVTVLINFTFFSIVHHCWIIGLS